MNSAGRLHVRGKVRDVYEAGPDQLLLVATDRISAFDVVLPDPIPDKGRVLTGLSAFWFDRTADLAGNHVVGTDLAAFPPPFSDEPALAGRAMLVRRAAVVPIECVARGYISGSGWAQYRDTGRVCGIPLRSGLVESERLDEPIFTPTTKAAAGHDLPLPPDEAVDLVGRGLYERLKELTLAVYERLEATAGRSRIIVADTKLEFGFADGELILIDEVGTPDSSRFWPVAGYVPGGPQPSYDKQFVRDWLDSSGWDHEPPAPRLADEVVAGTRTRYVEAFEGITGEPFAAVPGAGSADDEAALDRLREEHG
jgi:phosphoribosylaminoimidazole-succinocarboxamide synthase